MTPSDSELHVCSFDLGAKLSLNKVTVSLQNVKTFNDGFHTFSNKESVLCYFNRILPSLKALLGIVCCVCAPC